MSKIVDISHHRVDFPGDILRQAPRRPEDRQQDYDSRFDYRTMFSDAFPVEEGVELLGPPMLNTRDTVLSSKFYVDGEPFSGTIESRDRHRISRTILHGVKDAREISLQLPDGNVRIGVNRFISDFSGRRVLVTQQKDNPQEWIRYWIEFHAVHHGIDGVLIYDNRSTNYDTAALEDMLRGIESIAIAAVVDWDIPYGATGGPNQVWDSDFGQHQVLEHAMRYVLADAKSVIQQDVDELVMTDDGRSVCEIIEGSDLAELRYPRRQILQVPTHQLPPEKGRGYRLHSDYAYYRTDGPELAGKYVCIPSRVPRSSHFLVHGIEDTKRAMADGIVARHYGGIRIEWRAGEGDPVSNVPLSAMQGDILLDEKALVSYCAVHEGRSSSGAAGVAVPLTSFQENNADDSVNEIDDLRQFNFPPPGEVGRWRYATAQGYSLDFAVFGTLGRPLVASFHGALDRSKYSIPRFERLKTLSSLPVSSVYFADPLLEGDSKLELAWFEGGQQRAIIENIVGIVRRIAALACAPAIVHSGSSGGGFAALRAAAMMPGTTALVFNPQTAIGSYLAGGNSYASQRAYVAAVWPEVFERVAGRVEGISSFADEIASSTSVLLDYESPIASRVVYCNNVRDFHFQQHYMPFLASAARGGNLSRVEVIEYDAGEGSFPPNPEQFLRGLEVALAPWPV